MQAKSLPPSIRALQASLARRLPPLLTEYVFSSSQRERAMRSDRKKNILSVLTFCLSHFDVSTSALVRRVSTNEYVTLTPAYVAEKLNLSVRTVTRIFSYLTELKILVSDKQQKLKIPVKSGNFLIFTSVRRRLTDKLFQITGLLKNLQKDKAYRLVNSTILNIKRLVCERFVTNQPQKDPVKSTAKFVRQERSNALSAADILQASLFLRRE